jgi:L-iditol 2-dehydrogenase
MAAPAVGSDAVVIGAGFMGIMNVIALKARGARVIVTEMSAPRLELARAFGADEVVDASQVDAVEAVMALTDGRGAQTVVTAIGHASANEQGLAMLSHRGSLVLFASAHPEEPIEVSPNFLHKTEQRLVGALSKDKQDFHTAVRMIRHGLVDLEPLIQGAFGLGELEQALDLALEPHTYRVLVTP